MEKSNKFLKVTGILMIIGGGIGLLFGIFILIFGVLLGVAAIHNPGPGIARVAGLVETGVVLALVGTLVQFIAGIVGVKNAKNPEKANLCVVLGIINALLVLVSLVLDTIGGGVNNFYNVFLVFFGLLLPTLYLVGAFQLKTKEDRRNG